MDTIIIKSRTDCELQQLVKDMFANKVFHNGMLKDEEDVKLYSIFLPLEQIELKNLVDWNDVGMVYEYANKAIDLKDGNPVFNTINFVHSADMHRMSYIWQESQKEHSCSPECNHKH